MVHHPLSIGNNGLVTQSECPPLRSGSDLSLGLWQDSAFISLLSLLNTLAVATSAEVALGDGGLAENPFFTPSGSRSSVVLSFL